VTGVSVPTVPTLDPTGAGNSMTRSVLPVRPELVGQQPYGAPQLQVPVVLNVNENPYPPSEQVVAAIGAAALAAARGLNRYPERDALALRAELADYLSADTGVPLSAAQVWAANGSNEVMQQVLQAFGGPGRTALSFGPTYSMYPEYARNTNTGWVIGRRSADFTIDPEHARSLIREHRPDVVLLASPNNPTGTALPLETVEAVHDATEGIVVVDEAYAEFRRDGVPSAVRLLAGRPRLAVSRTMSKAFALAGGRVGYLAADPAFVDALRVVRLPYHLSAVTQAVARAALTHRTQLLGRVAQLRQTRDELSGWLSGRGYEVAESDANFVLFGRFADRHAAWQGLLDRGVLIREVGPDGWLRVSMGTPAEMSAFRGALDGVGELPAGARARVGARA